MIAYKKEGRKNTNKRSNKVGWDILMKETWKDGLTTPVKIMDCPTGTGKTYTMLGDKEKNV